MPLYGVVRTLSRESAASDSSSSRHSTGSGRSTSSSNTQYTTQTHGSRTKPVIVYPKVAAVSNLNTGVDPRSSADTYASTVASEDDVEEHSIQSLCPRTRYLCYEPDTFATTASEFAELYPSTRRLLIQHDDTTPDGNLNLRVDTELSICKGQRIKLTLFHLRIYNLADRRFSLRRYQRQSGREVCSAKRKYVKPAASSPLPQSRRGTVSSAFTRMGLRSHKSKSKPDPDLKLDDNEDSDDGCELVAAQGGIDATIPTDNVKLEFSNYAQVEVGCGRESENKYDFEYWGNRYTWRRNVYRDDLDMIFSLELVNQGSGACVAHITPDKLSSKQTRQEAAQGGWIPPCSMRLLDKHISNDLGDVIVATGLVALVDDCIKRHWNEPHRS
jgi:hypothetical protein